MKMNVKGNDNFRTPDHIFKQLNNIFNFTLDAACTTEDCKCSKGFYHDQGVDALNMSWGGNACFAIHHLAKKQLLSKRLMKKLSTVIVRSVSWCCRPTAKTARVFKPLLKRTSFMKHFPDVSLSLIRKRGSLCRVTIQERQSFILRRI